MGKATSDPSAIALRSDGGGLGRVMPQHLPLSA